MFTDDAVTPVRLEILVDLLRRKRTGISREEVYRLLQPKTLEPNPQFIPAMATIRAALELSLVEDVSGMLSLAPSCKREKSTRVAVLTAFGAKVLRTTDVEKYFDLF